MNKYTELSDFEINLKVAQLIFSDNEYDVIKQSMEVVKFQNGNGKGVCHAFAPCHNPADAMPIIIENCIGILPYKNSSPLAFDLQKGLDRGILVENKNIYRAAMEVFLMMKEAENEG